MPGENISLKLSNFGISKTKEHELYELTKIKFQELNDNKKNTSFLQIPRVISKDKVSSESQEVMNMRAKLHNICKKYLLKKYSNYILDDQTLKNILIEILNLSISVGDRKYMRFNSYCKLQEIIPSQKHIYLNDNLFSQLYQNSLTGGIDSYALFITIKKRNFINKLRIELTKYDINNTGYIDEDSLATYISTYIRSLPRLMNVLQSKYFEFYLCNVTTWFSFFLDPLNTSKIKITDILTSGYFEILDNLYNDGSDKSLDSILRYVSNKIYEPHQNENHWFCFEDMINTYDSYVALDIDKNGMLNEMEFNLFHGDYFTDAFANELFMSLAVYEKEIDYHGFVKYVIAFQNISTIQGTSYFFKILDVDNDGFLGDFDIYYFYKEIYQKVSSICDENAKPFEYTRNEIFDLVKPKHSDKISLSELIKSQKGHLIINILSSVEGFLKHEYEEDG